MGNMCDDQGTRYLGLKLKPILKHATGLIAIAAFFSWGISILSALVSHGHVIRTKAEAGQYLLFLRVGKGPAIWEETTALRYWFETISDVVALGTMICAVVWAVVYYLWHKWQISQAT